MNFGTDTWWIVATAATIVIGIISYFLKRTITKQDKHEEDINHIKMTYVTRDQLREFKEETNNDEDEFPEAIKKSKAKKTKLRTFEPVPLTQYEEKLLIKECKLFEEPPTIRLHDDGSYEILTKGFKRIKILKIDRHARRVTFLITIAGNKMEFTMSFIKADEESATKADEDRG